MSGLRIWVGEKERNWHFRRRCTFVTEQDPKGPSWDRPLPHILCFGSSLKYLDNSIWCTFPELFYRYENPHQMEEINYLMIMSMWPPGLPAPKDYNMNPCDTALLPHYQSIRELCTSWSHTLGCPALAWPLKMLCWNPWGIRTFWALAVLDSLYSTLQ